MRSNDETGVLPFYYFEPSQYYYTPPYVTAQPDVSADNRHVMLLCVVNQNVCVQMFLAREGNCSAVCFIWCTSHNFTLMSKLKRQK